MNGKQAKRLRRAANIERGEPTRYQLSPSKAYFVQSIVVTGAVHWITLYRKIPKVSLALADGLPRRAYQRAKRAV